MKKVLWQVSLAALQRHCTAPEDIDLIGAGKGEVDGGWRGAARQRRFPDFRAR